MKKKLSVLWAIVLIMLMLGACGGSDTNQDANAGNNGSIESESDGTGNHTVQGGQNEQENQNAQENQEIQNDGEIDVSSFVNVYWYLTEDFDDGNGNGRNGFCLKPDGTMTMVTSIESYYEVATCRYDNLKAEKEGDGIRYSFNRYFEGSSEGISSSWFTNAQGLVEYHTLDARGEEVTIYYGSTSEDTFYKDIYGVGDIEIPSEDYETPDDDVVVEECDHEMSGRIYVADPSDNTVHDIYCDTCNELLATGVHCEYDENGFCRCKNECEHVLTDMYAGYDEYSHRLFCDNRGCKYSIKLEHEMEYDEYEKTYVCKYCSYGSEYLK